MLNSHSYHSMRVISESTRIIAGSFWVGDHFRGSTVPVATASSVCLSVFAFQRTMDFVQNVAAFEQVWIAVVIGIVLLVAW